MDYKVLKSDLTYALKKMIKEGKTITFESGADNLSLVNGQLVLTGDEVDVLEALVLIKGFICTKEQSEYGIPLIEMLVEQGQIAKSDLYDFLDGLENVAGSDKSEFYKVGVYIREKFTPTGCRTETLYRSFYKGSAPDLVRRFVIYSRPLPGKKKSDIPSIVEVECEEFVPPLSKTFEFCARIFEPKFMWEPTRVIEDGVLKEIDAPPVYQSHSIYLLLKEVEVLVKRQIKSSLDRDVMKGKIPSYTPEELEAKYASIQTVLLP